LCRLDRTSELYRLCKVATEAHEKEDVVLRQALDAQSAAYSDVAHGLTYWLFETTLVYIIFRSWAPLANVAWEHAVGEKRVRPSAFTDGRRGASEKCDLVLRGEGNVPRAAFEAKWWNSNAPAAGAMLQADVRKLRRTCAGTHKYLITFWWGTDAPTDTKVADDWCVAEGLGLTYVGCFETRLLGGVVGYFALAMIEVP
jgi:hypothetical protein